MNKGNDFELEMDETMDHDMQEIIHMLHAVPQVPVPAQFDLNLKRALKQEKARIRKTVYRRLAAAAAVFTIGIASVLLVQDGFSILPDQLQSKDGAEELIQQQSSGHRKEELPKQQSALANQETADDKALSGDSEPLAKHRSSEPQAQGSADQLPEQAGSGEAGISPNAVAGTSMCDDREETHGGNISDAAGSAVPESAMMQESAPAVMSEDSGEDTEVSHYGAFRSVSDFDQKAKHEAEQFAFYIGSKDIKSLTVLRSDLPEETWAPIVEIYTQILGGQVPVVKKLDSESLNGVKQTYELTANGKSIILQLHQTTGAILLKEPILDLYPWLREQLAGSQFELKGYAVDFATGNVTFQVSVTAEEPNQANQLRSITWKKNESL